MTTTSTAARCVGESSRRSSWGGGTQPLGRCQRPVGFAVMGWGRHGGHTDPHLTCQAHLGGLVAGQVTESQRPRSRSNGLPAVTVLAVSPAGDCARCGERPEFHEPGAACPGPL